MIGFLQNKSLYDGVLEELSFHIVLEREMRELIMLVTKIKKARKILVDYHLVLYMIWIVFIECVIN